jgi:hypothetical protein
MESVGFKEWAIVCEALGRGEQSILVRKGGIAEGRAGFAFRHPEFFLFPTFFHEQLGKTRLAGAEIPREREGEIEIRFLARIVAVKEISSWERIAALEPLHILEQSVVRERFDCGDRPGLHVALVRASSATELGFSRFASLRRLQVVGDAAGISGRNTLRAGLDRSKTSEAHREIFFRLLVVATAL